MSMRLNSILKATTLGSLLALAVTGRVSAVDGVIEINQARALAGGVTPGDSPGFPVTISQPGSYRLTGNLDVRPPANPGQANPENVTAIKVTVGDVTLDLNGFVISGPVSCTFNGTAVVCSISGSGNGIDAGAIGGNALTHVVITDGAVIGFGHDGIHGNQADRVERVRVSNNANFGIDVDNESLVSRCKAQVNGQRGISAGPDSVVSDNIASANGEIGILGDLGSTITGNTSTNNVGAGINAGSGVTLTRNSSRENKGRGISTGGGCILNGNSATDNTGFCLGLGSSSGYTNNVIDSNTAGTVTGGVSLGQNLCNGVAC